MGNKRIAECLEHVSTNARSEDRNQRLASSGVCVEPEVVESRIDRRNEAESPRHIGIEKQSRLNLGLGPGLGYRSQLGLARGVQVERLRVAGDGESLGV